MKPQELRKKSNEELLKLKKKLDIHLIRAKGFLGFSKKKDKTKVKGYTQKGVNTSNIRNIRRDIARILTILRERELE